jgi:hypothetical protein
VLLIIVRFRFLQDQSRHDRHSKHRQPMVRGSRGGGDPRSFARSQSARKYRIDSAGCYCSVKNRLSFTNMSPCREYCCLSVFVQWTFLSWVFFADYESNNNYLLITQMKVGDTTFMTRFYKVKH